MNGTGETHDHSWVVTMLGPSRVGKTSLLTALQVAANEYFAGTPVRVEPEDEITRRAFADNNRIMISELKARRFSPLLKGDEEERTYGLTVSAGVDTHRLVLRFQDYPGGYLSTAKSSRVTELLADSPTAIIPIDATLLMEAGDDNSLEIMTGLGLVEVEEQVRMWAKTRKQAGDRTRLLLVPVKCESYFNDNGGQYNEADKLFKMVQKYYGSLVEVYRQESGRGPLMYAPVDTIGPIELMDVTWVDSESGVRRMKPEYSVRSDAYGAPLPRKIKGAEPVLAHLVKDVLTVQDEALRLVELEADRELTDIEKQNLRRRSNWFKRFLDDFSGNHTKRKVRLEEARTKLDALNADLVKLTQGVDSLSGNDAGRVRVWP